MRIKLSDIYTPHYAKNRRCQLSNCGNRAQHETGFYLGDIEFYIFLCDDCLKDLKRENKVTLGEYDISEYMCSICEFPNDPVRYSMRRIGKRWYHLVCIDQVIKFIEANYNIKIDPKNMFKIKVFEAIDDVGQTDRNKAGRVMEEYR